MLQSFPAEQQMRLQSHVTQHMTEGVLIVSPVTGRILYTNARLDRLLGYPPGQLPGQQVAVLRTGSDTERQALADAIAAALQSRGEWRGALKRRSADGREIWFKALVFELVDEGFGKVWVALHGDPQDRCLAQDAPTQTFDPLRLSLHIQDSIEAERLAIARDVHDQLGAALTGMRMQLESLAARIQPGAGAVGAELLALADMARTTQLAARDICARLRPQLLEDLGLMEACRCYLEEWSQQVGIRARGRFGSPGLQPQTRLAADMFRVLQELLTNVARHSQASEVRLLLCAGRSGYTLRVRDNGHGFLPGQAGQGWGLKGVQERVLQHNGRFQLKAGAKGTQVTVTLQNAP